MVTQKEKGGWGAKGTEGGGGWVVGVGGKSIKEAKRT